MPTSGFFEWTGPKGERQPWYITSIDSKPLSIAGLYDRWIDPNDGEHVWSFTIIVGEPNDVARQYHNRMPVILDVDTGKDWLREPRMDLLVPCPNERLTAWPVTSRMSSSRYQEPDAITPIQWADKAETSRVRP